MAARELEVALRDGDLGVGLGAVFSDSGEGTGSGVGLTAGFTGIGSGGWGAAMTFVVGAIVFCGT